MYYCQDFPLLFPYGAFFYELALNNQVDVITEMFEKCVGTSNPNVSELIAQSVIPYCFPNPTAFAWKRGGGNEFINPSAESMWGTERKWQRMQHHHLFHHMPRTPAVPGNRNGCSNNVCRHRKIYWLCPWCKARICVKHRYIAEHCCQEAAHAKYAHILSLHRMGVPRSELDLPPGRVLRFLA